MKITVVGTGYVGLVTGACLAEVGNDVLCLDLNEAKVAMLKKGRIPIVEPGLEELVKRNAASGRLKFTSDIAESVSFGAVQIIAVGTPPDEDGSADMTYVQSAAESIGRHMTEYKLIVDKSTVPVGTADRVRAIVSAQLSGRGIELPFSVVSNPEFLKEGAAVEDFMRPDRIVVGASDERAISLMRSLYAPFNRSHERLVLMDPRSAELTKYAANAMLATRISFMNELANLAEKLGADIDMVRHGIGSDARIGHQFLYAGCGYGGSCFPKDVQALIRMGLQDASHEMQLLRAVERVNDAQKRVLSDKIKTHFGADLTGLHFALWGLAFKPNTDDMREAPSRYLVADLLEAGASVTAHDPAAMDEARHVFGENARIAYADGPMQALEGADALVILTEWKAFRSPDFAAIKAKLKQALIFDGRNLYDPAKVRELGIDYRAIGR